MLTTEQVNDLINASREMDEGPTHLVRRIEAAVRERLSAALRERHERSKHYHNYYACLARELDEGLL